MIASLLREAADRLAEDSVDLRGLSGWRCRSCQAQNHSLDILRHAPDCLITRLRTAADQMDGMVLVPVEPTEAMIEAGAETMDPAAQCECRSGEVWKAMIAASQSIGSVKGE